MLPSVRPEVKAAGKRPPERGACAGLRAGVWPVVGGWPASKRGPGKGPGPYSSSRNRVRAARWSGTLQPGAGA